jgi:molecular chaperone GrpE
MRALLPSILASEFVVDEKPEQIFLSREEGGLDLLEAVSGAMREIERLQDLNVELQSKSSQPVETEKLLRSLLPTLDSFDRVLSLARSYPKSEEIDNWLKSVESISFRMLALLESYGLYQLHCAGKKVDLNLHEVVEYRPSQDHPNDVVISERQKGYVFRGKLLRDAKVVVAYNERR